MNTYLKIFIILAIGFSATGVSYNLMEKGLERYNIHKYPRTKEIFTGNNAYDILFVGSSRTHTTIMPSVIDSITGLRSFNAGAEGGGLLDFKMIIDGYLLKHPAPRYIVLTVDPTSFEAVSTVYNPVQYFPFLKMNSSIERTFSATGYRTFLIKHFPMFNFVYMDDYSKNNAFSGYRGKTEMAAGEFQDKGYLSNSNNCVDLEKYTKDTITLAPANDRIRMFQAIADTCNKRNIRLVVTYAPEYRFRFRGLIRNFNDFIDILNKNVYQNRLTLYRDDSLAMNVDSCLFRDVRHVNTPGAGKYSLILGQRLLELSEKERVPLK